MKPVRHLRRGNKHLQAPPTLWTARVVSAPPVGHSLLLDLQEGAGKGQARRHRRPPEPYLVTFLQVRQCDPSHTCRLGVLSYFTQPEKIRIRLCGNGLPLLAPSEGGLRITEKPRRGFFTYSPSYQRKRDADQPLISIPTRWLDCHHHPIHWAGLQRSGPSAPKGSEPDATP